MARIEAMVEFNLLYGEYTRALDMLLVETGLSRVQPRLLRHIDRLGATSAVLRDVRGSRAGAAGFSIRSSAG